MALSTRFALTAVHRSPVRIFAVLAGMIVLSGCAEAPPVAYRDARYGLTFLLTSDWKGFSVETGYVDNEQYSAEMDRQVVVGRTLLITLHHPPLKSGKLYQEIPILVFTTAQWKAYRMGSIWPDMGAGGAIEELWHNSRYVFGLYSRYDVHEEYRGIDEVRAIFDRNAAAHESESFSGPWYPSNPMPP